MDVEEGEITKYFLKLEKCKARLLNISKLNLENNVTVTSHKSILAEQRKFYENLYEKHNEETEFEFMLLNSKEPKITELERALCEEPISLEEYKNSIDKMKLNKSHGTWRILSAILAILGGMKLVNQCFGACNIPLNQTVCSMNKSMLF